MLTPYVAGSGSRMKRLCDCILIVAVLATSGCRLIDDYFTEDHDLQKWQEQIDRHNREHPNDPIHGGFI